MKFGNQSLTPYLRALIITCTLSIFVLASYQKISCHTQNNGILGQTTHNLNSDFLNKTDIKNRLKPVKILVMAFPR